MVSVCLKPLEPNNKDDQLFTYDIIEYRWRNADIVNIKYKTGAVKPTFEQHVEYLKSSKYKHLYKIFLGEIPIGMFYHDINSTSGTFIPPSLLKKAMKFYRSRGEDIVINKENSVALQVYILFYKLHPEITTHYAVVNPNNKLSLQALLNHGYELVEYVLVQETVDGERVKTSRIDKK